MSLLDTSLSDGLHWCNNWDDIPPDQIDTQGNCLSITYLRYADLGQYWGRRIYFPANDVNAIYVNVCSVGAWQGWERITTDAPPQEFDIPLAEGWLPIDARYAAVYWKTQESIVNISLGLKSDHTVTNGETIAILPSGFSPKKSLKIPITAVNQNGLLVHGYVDINRSDGTIQIYKITDQIKELCFPTTNFLANS